MSEQYSKAIMADVHAKGDGYEQIPSDDLVRVLLTSDGRGPTAKKKALDILLEREHDKGFADGYESEYVGDLK